MAYDENLAGRISAVLARKGVPHREMKMMGGLCFMVDEKMCVGVINDRLMARIGPERYAESLQRPGCQEMKFTGRPMKGYVFVDAEATDREADLEYWVQLCLDFNPMARASKKKR